MSTTFELTPDRVALLKKAGQKGGVGLMEPLTGAQIATAKTLLQRGLLRNDRFLRLRITPAGEATLAAMEAFS